MLLVSSNASYVNLKEPCTPDAVISRAVADMALVGCSHRGRDSDRDRRLSDKDRRDAPRKEDRAPAKARSPEKAK